MKLTSIFIALLAFANYTEFSSCTANKAVAQTHPKHQPLYISPGAERMETVMQFLKGKRIALMVNQTSMVRNRHLLDTLLSLNMEVKKIFSPEHGFRGNADAGEKVNSETDAATGLPIVSLYGKTKRPSAASLADVDVVVFDIQDVGARFFTYISSMHYLMDACAEYNKTLLVLDRPNPNGHYVDGPVLQSKHRSFIGMHPIPIVHGLTVAELAQMINGEHWLDSNRVCPLQVVSIGNYTHKQSYDLPVKPSPNLPNAQSVALYPSICLFEGTELSLGRGTLFPFQVVGGLTKNYGSFSFIPRSISGMAKSPLYQDQLCYGIDLRNVKVKPEIDLSYILNFYKLAQDKPRFFLANNFFNTLAGNETLQAQIKQGLSESDIKKTWEADLSTYKKLRKKYLLYPDFE